jgi:hypothetical protein
MHGLVNSVDLTSEAILLVCRTKKMAEEKRTSNQSMKNEEEHEEIMTHKIIDLCVLFVVGFV